jgi:asparagine synthase (glutamine-hydrolysing)
MAHFPPRELRSLLTPALSGRGRAPDPWAASRALHARAACALGDVAALPVLDALTYMTDDVLVKVDRTSMLNSLETRAPLLDHHVLEWVARLPFAYKLRGHVTQVGACASACARCCPPRSCRAASRASACRSSAGSTARSEPRARGAAGSRTRARGWLEPVAVRQLLTGGDLRGELRAKRMFTLVCLELWARTYLDRSRALLAEPADGP